MEHPADEVFIRFLAGTSSRQENREIVRHLLSRCAVCAARLRTLDQEPPVEPDGYDEALSRCAAWLRERGPGRCGRAR